MGLEPLLLKATEAAKLLALGRSKVFAMVAAGLLPSVRIGRQFGFRVKLLSVGFENRPKRSKRTATLSFRCT